MDKQIKKIFILTILAITFAWGLNNYQIIGGIFSKLSIIISPFLIGLIIAFILNIPMGFIEKNILKKTNNKIILKLKRSLALLISIFMLLATISFTIILVIPQLINAFNLLASAISQELPELEKWLNSIFDTYSININDIFNGLNLNMKELTTNGLAFLTTNLSNIFGGTVQVIIVFLGGITNFLLSLIFAIYMLISKEKLKEQTNKLVKVTLSAKNYIITKYLTNLTVDTFKKFITGQVTEAVILGTMCFVGMLILGFPYAATIGVLTGVLALIPIVGAFLAGIVGVILIFPVDPVQTIWYIVFVFILQQIEGNLIYPKVVGNSIGLPGLWVLSSVTIGATIWGVTGMIVMVPVFSVFYCLLKTYVKAKIIAKTTKGYSEEKPMIFKEAFLLAIKDEPIEEKTTMPKSKNKKLAEIK